MKTRQNTCAVPGAHRFLFYAALAALVAYGAFFPAGARAQVLAEAHPIEPPTSAVDVPVSRAVELAELTTMDLTAMSRAWWKAVRKDHTRLLGSSDAALKEQALKNLIFFARVYREQVDLTRAVPKLYKIYQRDANEAHRIMALSALSAIGNRNVMALLRKEVSAETSERVRRRTLYALATYYKNQGGS